MNIQPLPIMAHHPQSSMSYSGEAHQPNHCSLVVPGKVFAVADIFETKDHLWFATSQIPTDLSVQVQDIIFHVHKYPLLSKCGYLGGIERQSSSSDTSYVELKHFPAGPETFKTILKFSYGLPIDINLNNVAALRCASGFLQMTDEMEHGNLVSETENFLTFMVLSSWKDTITVLKSCGTLYPVAETFDLLQRFYDTIVWEIDYGNSMAGRLNDEENWWFDDIITLRIDHFTGIISALRKKGLKAELTDSCVMKYAERWLLHADIEMAEIRNTYKSSKDQRLIIESIMNLLHLQQGAVSCKFLFWILKMAIVYSASPSLICQLEKQAAMELGNATVNDLLILSHRRYHQGNLANTTGEYTMHNTDAVQRIFENFLMHKEQTQSQKPGKVKISKLLDAYLTEIAKDPQLSINKFEVLAKLLPEDARTCNDGLYRAIDTYLKIHFWLSERDRIKLCKVIDCEKLSLDACTLAARNELLPLRTVIQALFAKQVKRRTAMEGKAKTESNDNSDEGSSWSSTKKDIKNLQAQLEEVKMDIEELRTDYFELQLLCEHLNKKQKNSSVWTAGWRKIKHSVHFHGRTNVNETGEGEQIPKPDGIRFNLRRRKSAELSTHQIGEGKQKSVLGSRFSLRRRKSVS